MFLLKNIVLLNYQKVFPQDVIHPKNIVQPENKYNIKRFFFLITNGYVEGPIFCFARGLRFLRYGPVDGSNEISVKRKSIDNKEHWTDKKGDKGSCEHYKFSVANLFRMAMSVMC